MAVFVPNPDRGSVEELVEALSLELASRYRDVEDELIRQVAARARRDMELANELPDRTFGGLTLTERRRQNRILAELSAHRAVAIRELQGQAVAMVDRLKAADLAQRLVDVAAREGEAAAAAQLGFAARQAAPAIALPMLGGQTAVSALTLTGTATQAATLVALSLESRLEILNQRITRYPQDAYQRVVSLYSPSTLLGVTTSRVQQAATVQRFLAEGITGFVDRSNRRWTVGAYAEMAGRTSVNRAFNDAGTWRMGQAGIHLVTVVRGLDSCARCAAWAGKILSTDGTPAGPRLLPRQTGTGAVTVEVSGTVDEARASGWNHPNCRCRLVPFMPGLTVPQEDTTYDEAAEKERAEQRRLERDIRAAKRREVSAMDDMSGRRAKADVREAQAEMRAFIERTGRNRSSYREQLGFADGR
ncbi:phage minor capsid protein [Microbacterium sp. BR1]|uniref:phage minor capsid protein n=1 Tax=Microbacterium sp. BR1 TaxID=1070896 RepID=UPI000C2C537F|nr:phage minor capsid protein [Microbacterium sp. BR1]